MQIKLKTSLWSISLQALAATSLVVSTCVSTAFAQTGAWFQDRSKPTFQQILNPEGTFHYPSPSEYNLQNLGRFHLRGSVFHTPNKPHALERVRFLLSVGMTGTTNYPLLFKPNSKVGVMVAHEDFFDEFPIAEAAAPDIGKIISHPVQVSNIVTPSNPDVDITQAKVRIIRNPSQLKNVFLPNAQFFEVEFLLPTPFRLPSNRDIRIIPFIENWNSSAYEINFITLSNSGVTDSNWDQDVLYFRTDMASIPLSLAGYWSSNKIFKASSDYDGTEGSSKSRLALGMYLKPLTLNFVIQGADRYFEFENAQCLCIQKTQDIRTWTDFAQISGSTTKTLPYTTPVGETSAFFRLLERNASNQGNCLSIQ